MTFNNGHVRPPDTTKHESLGTGKHKDFHIKTPDKPVFIMSCLYKRR